VTRRLRLRNCRVCMPKCIGSPRRTANGRVITRGPPRFRDRATSRVPPSEQMDAPDPVNPGGGRRAGARIEVPAGEQPVAGPQHQGSVRFQSHHGERPRFLAWYGDAGQPLSVFEVLPLRHDPVRTGLPVVVQPVAAVPPAAVTSHLSQPWPHALGTYRKGRSHRGPVVGIGYELIPGIVAGDLIRGRSPHQDPGPEHSAYTAAAEAAVTASTRAPNRPPVTA
jgi:hypothetical protein